MNPTLARLPRPMGQQMVPPAAIPAAGGPPAAAPAPTAPGAGMVSQLMSGGAPAAGSALASAYGAGAPTPAQPGQQMASAPGNNSLQQPPGGMGQQMASAPQSQLMKSTQQPSAGVYAAGQAAQKMTPAPAPQGPSRPLNPTIPPPGAAGADGMKRPMQPKTAL